MEKNVPGHVADLVDTEKKEWWKLAQGGERRAMKAIYEKLDQQKVRIYRASEPCHLVEGNETKDVFQVDSHQPIPPQLLTSPLNIKGWRQDHRKYWQLYKLYLRKTDDVRFFTLIWGHVPLSELGKEYAINKDGTPKKRQRYNRLP